LISSETRAASREIQSLLHSAQQPLIIAHIRPDGDAISSVIGLGQSLANGGKQYQMVLLDAIPAKFKFLEGSDLIKRKAEPGYDLVVALDCSDQKRMGEEFADIAVDINIDHHITNERFAKHNLVLPEEPATAAVLARFLPEWGFPLTPAIASALLTGILTDTIGFRTSNVSPDSLRQAAQLVEAGANLTDLYAKALVSQSYSASLLWGLALSKLQKKGKLAWTSITLEDRKKAGYSGRDDADLTNLLSAIENIEIAILFNEQNKCKIKVSWRSTAGIDVSKIAQRFGGGGHPPAAGAEVTGTLGEVEEMILKLTSVHLKEQKSKGEN
jgi:phosphoesterase RecJ-like protein